MKFNTKIQVADKDKWRSNSHRGEGLVSPSGRIARTLHGTVVLRVSVLISEAVAVGLRALSIKEASPGAPKNLAEPSEEQSRSIG